MKTFKITIRTGKKIHVVFFVQAPTLDDASRLGERRAQFYKGASLITELA